MTDFEKWLEENYPVVGLDICEKEGDRYIHKPTRNMHDAYLAGQQSKEAAIQEMDQVIKMQDADLRKYEKQIEGLKEQLNNMEDCYIEKKKQVEDQQKRIDAPKSPQPKLHKTDIGDCLHFSTTMFHDGKATCFDCDAVVNHKREVIGVMQTKALRGAND